jgi:hypothetical protein
VRNIRCRCYLAQEQQIQSPRISGANRIFSTVVMRAELKDVGVIGGWIQARPVTAVMRRLLQDARDQEIVVRDGSPEFYSSLILKRWEWLELSWSAETRMSFGSRRLAGRRWTKIAGLSGRPV